MSDQPESTPFGLSPRDHRWLSALLILATLAIGFVVVDYVGKWVAFFSDVIMVFFLAWLLAFILSPVASGLVRLVPRLPRSVAVILAYTLLIVLLAGAIVLVAQQLYSSLNGLVDQVPDDAHLRNFLAPYQNRLNSLGAGQINLYDQSKLLLTNAKDGAGQLAKPIGEIAIASLGVFGNLLFIFFLSLYMAVDKERISRFLFRLVPPNYTDEAELLEQSVSRSFGGFLRGQAVMGVAYGIIAMLASTILGVPYVPVTATSSGVLQAIPFFGPFISWAPPVLAALFFKPETAIPMLIIMVASWFVIMNVISPKLMAGAVGLHPVVVLGSVLIGSKIAGIPGAIFAMPIAAVIASFFFYYLGHHTESSSVALRAARMVEKRMGRPVHVPRLPQAGEDEEVEPAPAPESQPIPARRRRFGRGAAPEDATPGS
ncbi:MAG TPA: AI-2E family transporter [Candidatus Limnocylindrales bacterium]